MTPYLPKRAYQSDAAAVLDNAEEVRRILQTIASDGRFRVRLVACDRHSGLALDETLAATAAWLGNKSPVLRADQLRQLRSWLHHCEREGVHPLDPQVWDVIRWLDSLAPDRTPMAVSSALATLRSWYSRLYHGGLCTRHPAIDLRCAPAAPTLDLTGAHCVSASAALVDYAEWRALTHGDETAWSERNWRDAALVAIWFHTAIAPPPLLDLDLADLQWTPETKQAPHRSVAWHGDYEGGRLPLTAQPACLLLRYLTHRAARQHLPLEQLSGPLFATAPRRLSPEQRLTDMEVINILARLSAECGLPCRASLTPCPTGHTEADRPLPGTTNAYGDDGGEPAVAPQRRGALTIKSHGGGCTAVSAAEPP
ncbi:hypothetical protein [Planotetraspora mira]|uniref:Integrase n=1 Tax=Planotetraspora mira TaxID=58121 RepID=A0A8J3TV39_9ACTN|nr:hypothetical protein [Planotetraspora mira]GII33011.1 hypothetical protein Pmi06nite_64530 [Planotetraspora mira]